MFWVACKNYNLKVSCVCGEGTSLHAMCKRCNTEVVYIIEVKPDDYIDSSED